jgi:hypothetical protein
MTYTVQELALQYAERLVEFHELDQHVRAAGEAALRQDVSELRMARDRMYDAQDALNAAALQQAEMNYA